jgi:phage terminase large subunit-like protein
LGYNEENDTKEEIILNIYQEKSVVKTYNKLHKLPLGSITAKGWLKDQLIRSKEGTGGHLDELELYKNAIPYTRLRDGMKGFTNKLLLATFTAGDDGLGFAAQHRAYMEKILRGTVTGVDAERTFVFLAQAPKDEGGEVDYLSPAVHRAANPAYGITIRPDDMLAAAQRAKYHAQTRKEFFTRSLNIFVNSFKAWFDLDEFRRSDERWR